MSEISGAKSEETEVEQKQEINSVDESSKFESSQEQEQADMVDHATYQRVLKQRKRDQEEKKRLAERLSEFEKIEKEKEQKELEAKGEFQKIKDLKEKEINALKEKVKGLEDGYSLERKKQSLLQHLSLKKKEYHKFIDYSKVAVDPDTGEVDDSSVKALAEEVMKTYPELLVSKDSPKIPAQAAQGLGDRQTNMNNMSLEEALALMEDEL